VTGCKLGKVFGGNAAAIVGDLQELATALPEPHLYASRAGIQGVFH